MEWLESRGHKVAKVISWGEEDIPEVSAALKRMPDDSHYAVRALASEDDAFAAGEKDRRLWIDKVFSRASKPVIEGIIKWLPPSMRSPFATDPLLQSIYTRLGGMWRGATVT